MKSRRLLLIIPVLLCFSFTSVIADKYELKCPSADTLTEYFKNPANWVSGGFSLFDTAKHSSSATTGDLKPMQLRGYLATKNEQIPTSDDLKDLKIAQKDIKASMEYDAIYNFQCRYSLSPKPLAKKMKDLIDDHLLPVHSFLAQFQSSQCRCLTMPPYVCFDGHHPPCKQANHQD